MAKGAPRALGPGSRDRRGPRALANRTVLRLWAPLLRPSPLQGPCRITSPVSGLRLSNTSHDLATKRPMRPAAGLHLPISTEGGTCFCSSLMRKGKPRALRTERGATSASPASRLATIFVHLSLRVFLHTQPENRCGQPFPHPDALARVCQPYVSYAALAPDRNSVRRSASPRNGHGLASAKMHKTWLLRGLTKAAIQEATSASRGYRNSSCSLNAVVNFDVPRNRQVPRTCDAGAIACDNLA